MYDPRSNNHSKRNCSLQTMQLGQVRRCGHPDATSSVLAKKQGCDFYSILAWRSQRHRQMYKVVFRHPKAHARKANALAPGEVGNRKAAAEPPKIFYTIRGARDFPPKLKDI